MSSPLVVLVGPPGAGKTTVGRLVAGTLGVAFRDTDDDVQATAGRTVADIFLLDGEPRFRQMERAALVVALHDHDGVLAVGGGAVLDPEVPDRLRGLAVVFLDVGPAEAARRVGLARDRPLLLGHPRARLRALLAERRPLYQQVATATVPTDGRPPEQVAADVMAVLR